MRCCLCRVCLPCLYLVCVACVLSDMNGPAVRRHARIASALFAFSYLPLSFDIEIGPYDRLLATNAISSELGIWSWTDLSSLCTYLAPDFPTLPRPPTDHHGAQYCPDELTDDCYYRGSYACFDFDLPSCFWRRCYFEEPTSNDYLPVFSALVEASNGCFNLHALYSSEDPRIQRLSSYFCPSHGSRTGHAAHLKFGRSLSSRGCVAVVTLSQLSTEI